MKMNSHKQTDEGSNSLIKILMVDNTRLNQKIISLLFQDYAITMVNNGQEAIDTSCVSLNSQSTVILPGS